MSNQKILIIDGSSLMYRAFFALPPLTTAAGQYTNAVYGFTSMLLKLLAEINPDKAVVALDKGKVTFRNELYADYKGKRQATPPELSVQFPLLQQVLRALGITVLELAGYEADDIIGTLAREAAEAGEAALIVTGDRDALQLVDDRVTVLLTRRGITDVERFDPMAVQEKYSVTPSQVIDLKGLMGDASDNIPGVPGVGEKTGVKLLAQFGSVENLLEHIPEVSGAKLKERLTEHSDLARLSKRLATIDRHVPLDGLASDYTIKPDTTEVRQLFTELEFKSLLNRFLTQISPETNDESQAALLAAADYEYQVIRSNAECSQLERKIKEQGKFVFFTLWEGKVPDLAPKSVFIALDEQVYQVEKKDMKFIIDLWEDGGVQKITDDAKPLYQFARENQLTVRSISFDAALAGYLLDPGAASYTMNQLAERYFPEVLAVPEEEEKCAAWSAATLQRFAGSLSEKLEAAALTDLYQNIELPLEAVLAELEVTGISVDREKLTVMSAAIQEKIDWLLTSIYDLAGETFNVNSTKQLGQVLFEKLQLPVIKKTKTGYSTDATVLERLAVEHPHPLIAYLLEYRVLTKLKSTYLDGLKPLIHPVTGRIHTTFNQTVTTTGRLSSSEPNLQNIPVRTEEGRKIRSLFVPGEGYQYLMSADYSQIELRVLAHMSADEHLIAAFLHGEDIHAQTAAKVFGVLPEEVTGEMRSRAKAVNFGIVYGISDYGLSRDIHVSRKEAAQYIDSYFALYQGVKELMDRMVEQAHEQGYVTTLFGRRRYLPDINSKNFNLRSFAERTAMNTPIQGTAADIIKKAMIAVQQKLKKEKLVSRVLLQVHDELVLEVTEKEIPEVSRLVKEAMETVVDLKVPLIADVKLGENWALAK